MVYQRVHSSASWIPVGRQNNRLFSSQSQDFKPLPAPTTPDGQIQLSRLPTSDWMKNDPLLLRWAQEEAATNSSDAPELKESIQAKLTVSTPGDKYEQEADLMAAKIMAMPDPAIQPRETSPCVANFTTKVAQRTPHDNKTVSRDLESRIANSLTGGSPLPSDVRAFMEPRFGADFSTIRVHTDSEAVQMCKEIGAKAFAVGSHIYYGAGYSPGKNELTAHELTHTIQQGGAKRLNKQVRQLPEPQEMPVAKEIATFQPHTNRQLRQFPLEESQPQPQASQQTFNRIGTKVSLDEIPSPTLAAKEFTSNTEPNYNKIGQNISEKLTNIDHLQAKSLLQNQPENQPLSISKTSPQIQANWFSDRAVQLLEAAISRLGKFGTQVIGILRSAGNAFGAIVGNPGGFLANLIRAVVTGFSQFSSNIVRHLKNGLVGWLTGSLASTGLTMPPRFDTRGIVLIVLQILGINYGRLRRLLVQRIGDEKKVGQLERGLDLWQRIANGGLAAAVQHMMQSAQTLQQTVMESIRNWVIETVVRQAVIRLMATFSGFGAIALAVEGIYKAIAFFIEQGSQIQALVNAVAASISNIAAGRVSAAADYIESTMARSLSVAISFLARIVGLGNVGQRVRGILEQVRSRVDDGVSRLIDLLVSRGKDWLARASGVRANNGAGSGNRGAAGGLGRTQPVRSTGQPPARRTQPTRPTGQPPQGRSQPASSNRRTTGRSQTPIRQERSRPTDTGRGRQPQPPTRRNPSRPQTPIRNRGNTGNLAAKLRDREIGQTQNFRADGEPHRLWIEVRRNRAIVMVASDPTPLRDVLNRPDVQKLNNANTDPDRHVEEALKILNGLTYDTGVLIAALTQDNNAQAEAKDQEIERAMRELAEHIKWIFSKLPRARLEIAKAVFGNQPFTRQQIGDLFGYLERETVRTSIDKWINNRELFTNRTSSKDTSSKVRFGFNEEVIKQLIAQQASSQGQTGQRTSDEDIIKYYQQILTWAGYTGNDIPQFTGEYNPRTIKAYRQEMRRLVLKKFGRDIRDLDREVLSQIAKQRGRSSFGPLKGEIFKQWIVNNISGVEQVDSITFQFPTSEGRQEVNPDLMQGTTMIEAKSYHGRGGVDKPEQVENYRQILERKIPATVNKGGIKYEKTFEKVKYMFSNDEARDAWSTRLERELRGYLELWSPRDFII